MRRLLGIAAMAVAVFLFGSVAVAAGNGSQTSTEHAHGTDVSQLGALGIVAPPDLPAGCPLALPAALVPVSGNAVQHQTTNKAGDFWFTSTVTADVDVYAAQVIDEEQDVVPVGPLLYTGHVTLWFGQAANRQNGTAHATLNFQGTSADGTQSLRIHGNFGMTINGNGDVTATPTNVECVAS